MHDADPFMALPLEITGNENAMLVLVLALAGQVDGVVWGKKFMSLDKMQATRRAAGEGRGAPVRPVPIHHLLSFMSPPWPLHSLYPDFWSVEIGRPYGWMDGR